MLDFATARRMMVDGQVRTADVTDRAIIQAMLDLPREWFVPDHADLAYLDTDLPVGRAEQGRQRRLLKPMVLARMVQALDLSPEDRVLVVGCATGYGAALVSRLAAQVIALEQDADLARQAETLLAKLGTGNVAVRTGSLPQGFAAAAPYDAILVEGCVEIEPDDLCAQLADDGRLVCIAGAGPAKKAVLYRRDDADITARPLFEASAAVLPGFSRAPAFVF
jgi:protein-L-isoaspartate(D-aspartate) O-methyltransferase